jgi:hypothetical protein
MKRFSIALALLLVACGGEPFSGEPSETAGSAGEAGKAGKAGKGGSAGESGKGGTAGTTIEAGVGGSSGSSGTGGTAGESEKGGSAGEAVDSGTDVDAGDSGSAGDSGIDADVQECIPGATKCLKGICLPNGTWDMKGCEFGCDGNPDHACYICTVGTHKCSDDKHKILDCIGLEWYSSSLDECPSNLECVCTSPKDCSCA